LRPLWCETRLCHHEVMAMHMRTRTIGCDLGSARGWLWEAIFETPMVRNAHLKTGARSPQPGTTAAPHQHHRSTGALQGVRHDPRRGRGCLLISSKDRVGCGQEIHSDPPFHNIGNVTTQVTPRSREGHSEPMLSWKPRERPQKIPRGHMRSMTVPRRLSGCSQEATSEAPEIPTSSEEAAGGSQDVPGRPPGGSQEDAGGSQETPKEAPESSQELPMRPQEAPGGSRSFPGSTKGRTERFGFRTGWLRDAFFCDTYVAKRSCPSLRHDVAHANVHSRKRCGFRIRWLSEAIFATPMARHSNFLH
jgi:hypothetical protein